ncbi:MAG: AMP-binding protein [Actinomycetota bacterium]|nr:AMP-binding protein [Actinomycetota bacterium]
MPIDAWLANAAAAHPGRVAIEAPGGSLTFAELLEAAGAVDVASGERVALEGPPDLGFAVRLYACVLRRAVAVPVDPRLGERERAAVLTSGAPTEPGAALIVHTSGTTGAPRPVTLTGENVAAQTFASARVLGPYREDRWLCPLPLSHVGGLMVLLRSAAFAITVVLRPLEGAELHGATLASLVPTQLARALDAGLEAPPALRTILLGGAGAPRTLLARAAAAHVPVRQTYGLTQACSSVTISEAGDLDTQGPPLDGIGVEIAPDGEILVSGPTVAGGGTLATGDLGRLDDRGRLTVIGRKTDTIVTGGENVAPAEVEGVLLEHPAVADAGVFGRADPEWGEAVTAHVVLRAPADPEALRAYAHERLAGYKVPKSIEVVDALPRTGSGKLLRRALSSRG